MSLSKGQYQHVKPSSRLHVAYMQHSMPGLLQAVVRCSNISEAAMASMGASEEQVSDHLYHASLTVLVMLADSPAMASMCLAFCEGANKLARTLRAQRTLEDWGARVTALATVSNLAALDSNASDLLLSQGLFATIEQALFVCSLATCRCRALSIAITMELSAEKREYTAHHLRSCWHQPCTSTAAYQSMCAALACSACTFAGGSSRSRLAVCAPGAGHSGFTSGPLT